MIASPIKESLEDLSPVIMAADRPAMTTIANVPIVSTGTYQLGANYPDPHETTFTAEDLQDVVTAAMDDPGVRLPRLKLGHTSEWGDAEPSFGKVDNLRLGDNGQTVYGDFVGVPTWLADILPEVYPNRSIEAGVNVETATGKKYNMVLSAVSLLGVVMPGVSTLEDLAGMYSETIPEGVEIEAGELITASRGEDMFGRKGRIAASTNLDDVRRAFYETIAVGDQVWWWIREVYLDPNELIVDNDEGELYRMAFEVSGDEVTFGEPSAVKIEYVNASLEVNTPEGKSQVVFASRSESRPESNNEEDEVKLTDEQKQRLGLAPDASDEDVQAALDKALENTQPAEEPAGSDDGEIETPEPDEHAQPGEGGTTTPAPEATPDKDTAPVTASSDQVLVDKATLAQLQAGAAAGAEVKKTLDEQRKEKDLSDAISAGKFPPARKEHYAKAYDADPDGTRSLLASLEAGIVPVTERGGAPDEQAKSDTYPESWFPEVAARNNQGSTDPVTQEVTR